MELSRGICVLCLNSGKVVFPPQARNITSLLCDILGNHIDVQKFNETARTLKVCPICLANILQVAEHTKNSYAFSQSLNNCSICQNEEHLVFIEDWPHFNTLLENIGVYKKIKRCAFCIQCINNLELLGRIKMNFFKKYPHLELIETAKEKRKGANKNSMSPQTISIPSDSESDTEHFGNVNNINSALKHLTPLKNSNYNIDQYKHDKKLLKQIAFVKLATSKQGSKNRSKYVGKKSTTCLNGGDPSRAAKHSFFKIKLKMNTNKTKVHRIVDGKVAKLKSKPNPSWLNKKLIVKISQMDLSKLKLNSNKYSNEGEPLLKTPTKASLKLMPDDPLFSNKKRKSVTFADDLDTEIGDGMSGKKANMEGTPLKSSLKKNMSPAIDLFGISNARNSGDEESALDGDVIKETDNESIDASDEENAQGYVEEIRKNNDSIFENLKDSIETVNKLQKRLINEIESNDDDDDDVENCDNENLKSKKVRRNSNEFENESVSELIDNGHDSTSPNNIDDESKDKNVDISDNQQEMETEIDDTSNSHKERNSIESESANESEESDKTTEKVNDEECAKPNKFISYLDNTSISSDSSREDIVITLGEYKKIKKAKGLTNHSENENSNTDTINSNTSIVTEVTEFSKNNSVDRIEEENGVLSLEKDTDSNLIKTVTCKGKVSENVIENNLDNNCLKALTISISDHSEQNIDKDKTVSVKEQFKCAEKEDCGGEMLNLHKTDQEANIRTDEQEKTSALSSAIQNVVYNKLQASEISSSDSYVTSVGGLDNSFVQLADCPPSVGIL